MLISILFANLSLYFDNTEVELVKFVHRVRYWVSVISYQYFEIQLKKMYLNSDQICFISVQV